MNESYWEKNIFFNKKHAIVAGCGIVGLNAAIHYKKINPKNEVIVIDSGVIPQGASTKNAGFACIGSAGELLSDLKKSNEDAVFGLVERRKKGLDLLRKILGDQHIDYQHLGGYELFDDESKFGVVFDQLDYINKGLSTITGVNETFTVVKKHEKFGFKGIQHIIKNSCEGQIDTGKMMRKLMQKATESGVQLLMGSKIQHIIQHESETGVILEDGSRIMSEQLLVCTNGFAKQLIPELDVKPARAQVLVTSPIKDLSVEGCFHFDEGYYYFRNIDNRILLGGGRNLDFIGETTTEFNNTTLIVDRLKQMLEEMIIPGKSYHIESMWSGIMGMGDQKTPIVKQVAPNTFCAVRLGGMGVAIGSLVGIEAVELMMENR